MTRPEQHKPKSRDTFGEDIAFGIQQTIACWATDFIDPIVSAKVQKWIGKKEAKGTLVHAAKGEVVGDTAALAIFLAMQKVFPQPVKWLTKEARSHFDKFYDKMARTSLTAWAADHNESPGSERYQHKLEEFKQFQASSFAKSVVISLGSIVSNVAAQKWVGNTNTVPVIATSKVIGAAITSGVVLGSRLVFPQAMRKLDKEMDKNFITPLINKTQKLLGSEPTTVDDSTSFVARLEDERQLLTTALRQ